MHIHTSLHPNLGASSKPGAGRRPRKGVVKTTNHAKAVLLAGYITYRDSKTKDLYEADVNFRDTITRGIYPGPRLSGRGQWEPMGNRKAPWVPMGPWEMACGKGMSTSTSIRRDRMHNIEQVVRDLAGERPARYRGVCLHFFPHGRFHVRRPALIAPCTGGDVINFEPVITDDSCGSRPPPRLGLLGHTSCIQALISGVVYLIGGYAGIRYKNFSQNKRFD
ncbi:hypothetical protein F4779DRAFT_450958 [Xylariaceae sp. FL0662B]|nr:hypothetical protein F4779DRAFT_450958 [Xylariaceae sp. FL0662B]